jgi:hypothetical protein
MRSAVVIRDFIYPIKERSILVTQDDATKEPNDWTVNQVSATVGSPSPHGVGVGEDFALIAARAGFYFFGGGTPEKLSQEIQTSWDSINWENAGDKIWVDIDIGRKEAYIGVPTGTSTNVDTILMMDYKEGFGDPAEGGRGRKWTSWDLGNGEKPAIGAMCRRIGQKTPRLVVGNNSGSGKTFELTPGAHVDDTSAIEWSYRFAPLPQTAGGRFLFGYMTGYAYGAGELNLVANYADASQRILKPLKLKASAAADIERSLNLQGNRISFEVGQSIANSWAVISKIVIWHKGHPFVPVRGRN